MNVKLNKEADFTIELKMKIENDFCNKFQNFYTAMTFNFFSLNHSYLVIKISFHSKGPYCDIPKGEFLFCRIVATLFNETTFF